MKSNKLASKIWVKKRIKAIIGRNRALMKNNKGLIKKINNIFASRKHLINIKAKDRIARRKNVLAAMENRKAINTWKEKLGHLTLLGISRDGRKDKRYIVTMNQAEYKKFRIWFRIDRRHKNTDPA